MKKDNPNDLIKTIQKEVFRLNRKNKVSVDDSYILILNINILQDIIKKDYNKLCPKCGSRLSENREEVSEGYRYACLECNEDFYALEI